MNQTLLHMTEVCLEQENSLESNFLKLNMTEGSAFATNRFINSATYKQVQQSGCLPPFTWHESNKNVTFNSNLCDNQIIILHTLVSGSAKNKNKK